MPLLGVNVDHIATVRQARGGVSPDPLQAVRICQKLGVSSVVMHLREDRRHIQDQDLFRVRKACSIRLNMEMSIAPSVMRTALKLKPDQATLVPERREEKTTEGGLDLYKKPALLSRRIRELSKKGIEVSLFIDPDERQIRQVLSLGTNTVEFHTGDYANQTTSSGSKKELLRLKKAVQFARSLGITTHAGHGLDYHNVLPVARIEGMQELNIGYSIIAESLWTGFEAAVLKMKKRVTLGHEKK